MRRKASRAEIERMKAVLAYQFSPEVADALLRSDDIVVETGGRGSIRGVIVDGARILTLRPGDGMFSITIEAARRIALRVPPPRFRVVVRGDRELSGSVLVGDVLGMDPLLRPGDEVIVVDRGDSILAVGRVKLPAAMLEGLDRGEVVRIRKRVK